MEYTITVRRGVMKGFNNMEVTSLKKEERTIAVNAIFVDAEGRILLGKRAKHKSGGGQWGLPGGTQTKGEKYQETLIREMEEELGVKVLECSYNNFFQCIVSENVHFDHHAFVVTKWSGDIVNNEPNKCDELRWFSIEELPWDNFFVSARNVVNYLKNEVYCIDTDFDYRDPDSTIITKPNM